MQSCGSGDSAGLYDYGGYCSMPAKSVRCGCCCCCRYSYLRASRTVLPWLVSSMLRKSCISRPFGRKVTAPLLWGVCCCLDAARLLSEMGDCMFSLLVGLRLVGLDSPITSFTLCRIGGHQLIASTTLGLLCAQVTPSSHNKQKKTKMKK